jgi:hypothetical protein
VKVNLVKLLLVKVCCGGVVCEGEASEAVVCEGSEGVVDEVGQGIASIGESVSQLLDLVWTSTPILL